MVAVARPVRVRPAAIYEVTAMQTIIGIDPGVSGAVAIVGGSGAQAFADVHDIAVFSVCRSGRLRTEYNCVKCVQLLRSCQASYWQGTDDMAVYLEDVRARPAADGRRDSLVTAHRIGVGIGLWQGITAALGLRLEMVTPVVWKRKMELLRCDKEASRHKACELFPHLADQLSRKKDHNRAEALLIAEYGRREQEHAPVSQETHCG